MELHCVVYLQTHLEVSWLVHVDTKSVTYIFVGRPVSIGRYKLTLSRPENANQFMHQLAATN